MMSMHRREWLSTVAGSCLVSTVAANMQADEDGPFRVHLWQRDPQNPIFPPGWGPFDVGCCMNPFIVVAGDEYRLYYAGADKQGRRRICLATCPIGDVTTWK